MMSFRKRPFRDVRWGHVAAVQENHRQMSRRAPAACLRKVLLDQFSVAIYSHAALDQRWMGHQFP
jgi:hypothetical protein